MRPVAGACVSAAYLPPVQGPHVGSLVPHQGRCGLHQQWLWPWSHRAQGSCNGNAASGVMQQHSTEQEDRLSLNHLNWSVGQPRGTLQSAQCNFAQQMVPISASGSAHLLAPAGKLESGMRSMVSSSAADASELSTPPAIECMVQHAFLTQCRGQQLPNMHCWLKLLCRKAATPF